MNEVCYGFAGLSAFFALCSIWLWYSSRPGRYPDDPIDITDRAAPARRVPGEDETH